MTLFLSFDNSSSQNSGKHFTYYYHFIIKDANEQPDEEGHRARSRRVLSAGASVPPGVWGTPPYWYIDASTNLEALKTVLSDFY